MNKNDGTIKNYIFVGNTTTGRDLSYLKNVKYILGELAYDIDGKEIETWHMLPLFIEKGWSYDEFNRIMQAQ